MTPAATTVRPARRRAEGRRWGFVGVAGEVLITLGVVVLLFVVWQLWWTDVLAHRAYDATRDELRREWGIDESVGRVPGVPTARFGKAFGLLYVPALRDRAWGVPIIEGTDYDLLTGAVGHHVSSALPGVVGNLAIAGHRTSYGAPFADIDTLHRGDQVIVETRDGWFVYELDRSVVVGSEDGWILDPVPGAALGTRPTRALITIYGCHPRYSAAQRYVWFGHLVDAFTKSSATPPAIERYGTEG